MWNRCEDEHDIIMYKSDDCPLCKDDSDYDVKDEQKEISELTDCICERFSSSIYDTIMIEQAERILDVLAEYLPKKNES